MIPLIVLYIKVLRLKYRKIRLSKKNKQYIKNDAPALVQKEDASEER